MKSFASIFIVLFALLVSTAPAACRSERDDHTLMVSIEPQRYLLERIAGPDWTVSSLLDRSSDPENFDPSMSALKSAAGARAYFAIGQMAFEDELLAKLLDGNRDMPTFNTSAGIDLIEGHGHDHAHSGHDHGCDGHAEEADPHVWCSVRNAKIMAANMRDAMISLDPDNQALYTANCDRLLQSLDSLDRAIAERLAPERGNTFLVWHPSLSYFARDYGLTQLTIGSENKEMSAASFRDRIDHAREAATQVFFVDAAIDSRRAEEIARQVGARCKVLNLTSADWLRDLDAASRTISSSPSETPEK